MTSMQIALVQASFSRIAPSAESVATTFYDRLFEIAPHLRSMFKNDLKDQGRKLMQMLAMVVSGLDRFSQLAPAVEGLGERHGTYGVCNEDYAPVGEALLWTLKHSFGDEFTLELEEAWTNAYVALAGVMQGAHGHAAARVAGSAAMN
jgi:nitric oxide dioxygenase